MVNRVSIIQPKPPSPSETFLEAQASRLPAEVSVVYLNRPRRSFTGRSPISRAWRLAFKMFMGRLWSRKTAESIERELKENRPDVVLAQYGPIGVEVVGLCKKLRVPMVVHFHGYDASTTAVLRRHAKSYRKMFADASRVIAVSEAMRRRLQTLGAADRRIRYNPCGIDCELFSAASPATASPNFLAVGRFTHKKAPQVTIRAFAKAARDRPDATLRMIGEGPLLAECKALADSLNIADRVVFLGAQPHHVVQAEMRKARCFVQHSVVAPNGDSEGTPVAILEAGASGLPIVSTRHAGIPDVVEENETGFLVDEYDVEGMAEHMRRFGEDPELAGRIGNAARQHVAENFSMEKHIARLYSILEEAAAC